MSSQNIPLKGRTDFRESSRIPATETIRVRAADSFGVFRGITDDFDCGESSGPGAPEAPPGVAPSHVGPPQAASRFQRARRVSSAESVIMIPIRAWGPMFATARKVARTANRAIAVVSSPVEIEQEIGTHDGNTAVLGLAHGAVLLAPAEDALAHRAARL